MDSELGTSPSPSKLKIVAIFTIVECFSLVLWGTSEGLPSPLNLYAKWLAMCGFAAGASYAAEAFWNQKNKKIGRCCAWGIWFVISIILFFAVRTEPTIKLLTFLQIGDSDDDYFGDSLCLTNDELYCSRLGNVKPLSKGRVFINDFARGAIVVPINEGESNKVFHFTIQNISPVNVDKLEVCIGVPINWDSKMDMSKWEKSHAFLHFPTWEFNITNIQFFERQSQESFYPYDKYNIYITNPCPPTINEETNEHMGMIMFSIKAKDYSQDVFANVLYIPKTIQIKKPFITDGVFTPDGNWRPTLSDAGFKKTQE